MKKQSLRIINELGISFGLGIIALLFFLLAGQFSQARSQAALLSPTPTDPVLARFSQEIEQYDAGLQNEALSDEMNTSLRAKRNYAAGKATERAEYLSHPQENLRRHQTEQASYTLTPYVTPLPEATPTSYNGPYPEFFAPMYPEGNFTSAWLIQNGNKMVFIIAGELVNDPEQGIVYIENNHKLEKYKTPFKDGMVKIKDVKDKTIRLEAKNGKKYYLNFEKKKFVDELGSPLPEGTPLPATPYPYP